MNKTPYTKTRLYSLFLTLIVMFLGLMSRRFQSSLPHFFGLYLGDSLWGLMVFFVFRFVFAHKPLWVSGLLSWLFAVVIEVSQLYHASWIDNIRATRLGGLVLGFGFLWSDIACYTVGIAFGIILINTINYIYMNLKGR